MKNAVMSPLGVVCPPVLRPKQYSFSCFLSPPPPAPERPPILSVSQDWVPILDKVFGQKWCNEIKELEGGGGRGFGERREQPLSSPTLTLEPSPSSPQQDPRWTPLEDMEVFSPDDEVAENQRSAEASGGTGDATSTTRVPDLMLGVVELVPQLCSCPQGLQVDAPLPPCFIVS